MSTMGDEFSAVPQDHRPFSLLKCLDESGEMNTGKFAQYKSRLADITLQGNDIIVGHDDPSCPTENRIQYLWVHPSLVRTIVVWCEPSR